MIRTNKPARDYEYFFANGDAYTAHAGIGHVVLNSADLIYGDSFVTDTMGIQVVFNNTRSLGGAESFGYSINTPWDAFSDSLGAWSNISCKIEIDGVTLTVNADCEWELHFLELRFYADAGGGYDLKMTVGETTQSGTNFDHRLNGLAPASTSALTDILTPSPGSGCANQITCVDPWPTLTPYSSSSNGSFSVGWQWRLTGDVDWTEDTVEILDLEPPDLACDCEATLPEVGINPTTENSLELTVNSLYSFQFNKTLACTYECVFDACTEEWQHWYLDETYEQRECSMLAVAISAPMKDHRTIVTAECNGTEEEDTSDTEHPKAYSEYIERGQKWQCRLTCAKLNGAPCIPDLDPPVCGDGCPDDFSCYNLVRVESQWPTFPPCTLTYSNPWNLVSTLGQYHRTDVDEDGNVWYRRASFSVPVGGFESEVQVTDTEDCSHPRMEEDGRPVLYLVYIREGSGLVVRASWNEGSSFGAETVLIADAYFPTIARDPIGTLCAFGFVYNSGTSGPGKIYMRRRGPGDADFSSAVAITSGGVDLEFEPDTFHTSHDKSGAGRWVLVAKKSGDTDLTEFSSTNECETFREVV